ncbi:MAG TPA: MBG domain-containing protein, partial [Puia sp.]|nr:MBG domain-containing protein [Puia sp.]
LAGAQQLRIVDFAIFGGSATLPAGASLPPAPGLAAQLGSSTTIVGGAIGSYLLVTTTGNSSITGNIYSNGTVILANGNTISGRIAAANAASAAGTILTVGSNASIGGNIDVKGNIIIGGGVVSGQVTHPAGTSYSGPAPSKGNVTGTPSLPIMPVLPSITTFPAKGTTNITTTTTLQPNQSYGNMTLTGNSTVTFSGPGVYTFASIQNSGNTNSFVFDFKNAASGNFYIYIYGDVNLNKVSASTVNGGDPTRIFAETHGTGSTSSNGSTAWTIGNGSAGSSGTKWLGTVWAPYGAISVGSGTGSSSLTGALWSATQVTIQSGVTLNFAPFPVCTTPNANAGPDMQLSCTVSSVNLQGSSTTSTVPGIQYSWTALNGGNISSGASTLTPTVNHVGTYVLTVTNPDGGCFATDTAIVTFINCILPYYPPAPIGKVDSLIGSELTSLYKNFPNVTDSAKTIFLLAGDSVWIDVIALNGQYQNVLTLLQGPNYGLTNIISNGPNSLIITGKYPIANLSKLNQLTNLIDYCRPLFPAVNNEGIAMTQGDLAMRTDFVRNGYHLNGDSVMVGVLSSSYNTLPGNPAAVDVQNGDLPGPGNPNPLYQTPVQVLEEYPFGQSNDEGRAMLQIVHDIAPKAKLAFRTGTITPGDMALGIAQLQQAGCNVLVDDVTFITEPFLTDGVISQAVDTAAAHGVAYFTAAGNFANNSYQGTYTSAPAPASILSFCPACTADNFGGSIYQKITLTPGIYTIVLQWQDSIYSLGQTGTGTQNDLDIYLTDTTGATLFGFNRNNIGGDPIEVLPFTVTANTSTNIMIVRAAGSSNVTLKYVIFRGNATISNYNGSSTVVGQANATGAMTVGADRYTKTPVFGVNPPQTETFSSFGGTPANGVVRNKPDFTAPDGVNTTVNFGSIDLEGDGLPNFFGTSCAAPHAAALAALLKQAKLRYYNGQVLSPSDIRTLLQQTALNPAGFDFVNGYGFLRADSAIQRLAAASPSLIKLVVPAGVTPGLDTFTVTVKGNYLSKNTQVWFRGQPIQTTIVNDSIATAPIPVFAGNPAIQAYTPPKTPAGTDGGLSNAISFFTIVKKTVKITANNVAKKYGEQIPAFSSTITVNDTLLATYLANNNLTAKQVGVDSIYYRTTANNLSNVNQYIIMPSTRIFDTVHNAGDAAILELYTFDSVAGVLNVTPMPLVITPRDTALGYGQKIGTIHFNYSYDNSHIADTSQLGFLNALKSSYEGAIIDTAYVLVSDTAVINGRVIDSADLLSLAVLMSSKCMLSSKVMLSNQNVSDGSLVTVSPASIFNYEISPGSAQIVNSKCMLSSKVMLSGQAVVNSEPVINNTALVNSATVDSATNSNTAIIIDSSDVGPNDVSLSPLNPINLITGIGAGHHYIVPAAFLSANFNVTYSLGHLNINPAVLTIKTDNKAIKYGAVFPAFTSHMSGFQYQDDSVEVVSAATSFAVTNSSNQVVPGPVVGAGSYSIVPSVQLIVPPNYTTTYVPGTLTVSPDTLQVRANDQVIYQGAALPKLTATYTGFVNGDSGKAIISGPVFTVTPAYKLAAGVYTITPSALTLAAPGNYMISYLNGTLYVDPSGDGDGDADDIVNPGLVCVDTLIGGPAGLKYVAHFSYKNPYSTPVYVPIGTNNYISATGNYNGVQPQLFNPGTSYFDIDFDGKKITWNLITIPASQRTAATVSASSTSTRCPKGFVDPASATTTNASTVGDAVTNDIQTVLPPFGAYPNPVRDRLTISFGKLTSVTAQDIQMYDLTGKQLSIARPVSISAGSATLNLGNLLPGMYFIRIRINEEYKIVKIVKL